MAGVEAVIGGAIPAIIKEVVKMGRSYFADKYKEHKGTEKMLDSLEASLPRISFAIWFAEQKTTLQNAILTEWLRQLKYVAHEAEDVMDDFEAKRIRDGLKKKGKVSEIATSSTRAVKSFFLSDKDEKKLKNLIEKIKNICDGIGDFTKMIELGNKNAIVGLDSSSTRETSSFIPKTKKIFGREKEMELILDMIIDCPEFQSYITYYGSRWGQDLGLVYRGNESAYDDFSPVGEETTNPFQNNPLKEKLSDLALGTSEKEAFEMGQSLSTSEISYADISIIGGKRLMRVLPLVGIGGVGKTTIAQVIYNHPRVQDHFDLLGWVYVADNTNHTRIVQDILYSFDVGTNNNTPTITGLDHSHRMLKNAISKKKFLIIFDDIREDQEGFDYSTWKKVLDVLAEYGAGGSIVIVTSEIKNVADVLGTLPPIYLDVLDWRKFLDLFEYHAFDNSNNKKERRYDKSALKPIGEEIARKLGGLPLAAEVVGTLLSSNLDKDHWEMVLNSNWWDLENISEKILLSLGASFQNLDPGLRQCFMFCSLFPKNYVFDKDLLVQMWMAHSLIHPTTKAEKIKLETNELKIEDIGRSMFDKLVDRFFFQTTVLKNRYVMHDLIREFAIATSSEMLHVGSNYLINNKTIPSPVRHLSIDTNIEDDVYVDHLQWTNKNILSLRTIMFFGFCKMRKHNGLLSILDKLRGLRLLDLSYIRISPIALPNNIIGQLSHLRFLDLSFSGITEVPSSLCQLVHLQVLDMRGCQFSKLPSDMNKLVNLRHLYASPETTSLIRGIGSLTNLQELEEFQVKKEEGFTISELKDLNLIQGQLTLKYLNEIPSKEMAIRAALAYKKCLTSLIFDMGYKHSLRNIMQRINSVDSVSKCVKHVEVLEGLKPHNNIRELKILGFCWNSFPSWIMNIHEMNNLRSIELKDCFHVESLPPLGSLPKLEILILEELDSITCIGKEFYGSSDVIFPSLRELAFSTLRR